MYFLVVRVFLTATLMPLMIVKARTMSHLESNDINDIFHSQVVPIVFIFISMEFYTSCNEEDPSTIQNKTSNEVEELVGITELLRLF